MTIQKFFKIFPQFFFNILFPIQCLGCGIKESYLCPDCLNKIHITSKIITQTKSHQNLSWWLNGIIVTARYRESKILQQAICIFKYKFVEDLAKPLGQLMKKRLSAVSFINLSDFTVIPIPLHKRRLSERGFNQNSLLARYCFKNDRKQTSSYSSLDQKREIIGDNILIRQRYTKPQVNLKRDDRLKNITRAFAVKKERGGEVKNKNFLLLDDILTTGATLNQAAYALKQAGAHEIWGLVLAED